MNELILSKSLLFASNINLSVDSDDGEYFQGFVYVLKHRWLWRKVRSSELGQLVIPT